jgi:glucose-1-phosphate thymidylyltransferase
VKGIIPTGGRGTRMQPITFSANKHFIPLANKPLIFYPIEAVAEAGVKEIAITYNPGWKELVKSYLGTGAKWGVKFTYILQEKPLGVANIIEPCEEFVAGDKFVFHLGDNIFVEGIKSAAKRFVNGEANGLVYRVKHPENWRLGVPYFDDHDRLIKYVEKPKKPPHSYAVPGVYFLDGNAFKCFKGKTRIIPSIRGEYEIPSVYQWLIDHQYLVEVVEYKGKWLDPGKFGDWIESNRYILDRKLETKIASRIPKDCRVEGRVAIGKGCAIENSEIRGPVIIGDEVKISHSYIGPFTSISKESEIVNSHVENSVLMERVKIENVKQPINESLLGTETEVTDEDGPTDWLKLFVGEKSKIFL